MDGFKRPSPRPQAQPPRQAGLPPVQAQADESSQRPLQQPGDMSASPQAVTVPDANNARVFSSRHALTARRGWLIVAVIAALILVMGVIATAWYTSQLSAADPSDTTRQRFVVSDGQSFTEVSDQLATRGIIKNATAFDLYARLQGKRGAVKASTCNLTKTETSAEILDKLTAGCHDFKSLTFYPGATIDKPVYKPASFSGEQNMYVKYILKQAGYSDAEITAALNKQYSSSIFAGKPAGATLEGYVFGETYYVDKEATAEQVLEETFSQMEKVIERNDLVTKFKADGLTLFQGITLASIVERELDCEQKPTQERKDKCYTYQQGIAQVFLNRLKQGMTLGSDVTFIYAADQMNVTPSPTLDSPYNTRKNLGLPPGPIAVPGELALKAVANPDGSDNLFFIAGDDGLIYFAKTNAEHEANVAAHCQILCSEL